MRASARLLSLLLTVFVLSLAACVPARTSPSTPETEASAPAAEAHTPVPAGAASVVTPTATASAAATLAPGPSPAPPSSETGVVTLNAVGDIMLERDIIDLMDAHGSVYPFEAVRSILADADITVANMEGTFTERGSRAQKKYTFRTPPAHARALADAGIDVVSLGNNHTMDYGAVGLADTLDALDGVGVRHVGAGPTDTAARRPTILEAKGLRLAFLSYNAVTEATFAGPDSPGVARATDDGIARDVSAARSQADIVIVCLHAGVEYTDNATSEQQALAHAAIDAGAAVVLGSHPHVLQGWERYRDGFVVYSLGNFVFDLDSDDLATLGPRPFQTLVLRLELTRDGVRRVSYRPAFIDPAQDRPLPATVDQAEAIRQRLAALSGTGALP